MAKRESTVSGVVTRAMKKRETEAENAGVVTGARKRRKTMAENDTHPLHHLPSELIRMLQFFLPASDIKNLRLSCRVFGDIFTDVFRHLTVRYIESSISLLGTATVCNNALLHYVKYLTITIGHDSSKLNSRQLRPLAMPKSIPLLEGVGISFAGGPEHGGIGPEKYNLLNQLAELPLWRRKGSNVYAVFHTNKHVNLSILVFEILRLPKAFQQSIRSIEGSPYLLNGQPEREDVNEGNNPRTFSAVRLFKMLSFVPSCDLQLEADVVQPINIQSWEYYLPPRIRLTFLQNGSFINLARSFTCLKEDMTHILSMPETGMGLEILQLENRSYSDAINLNFCIPGLKRLVLNKVVQELTGDMPSLVYLEVSRIRSISMRLPRLQQLVVRGLLPDLSSIEGPAGGYELTTNHLWPFDTGTRNLSRFFERNSGAFCAINWVLEKVYIGLHGDNKDALCEGVAAEFMATLCGGIVGAWGKSPKNLPNPSMPVRIIALLERDTSTDMEALHKAVRIRYGIEMHLQQLVLSEPAAFDTAEPLARICQGRALTMTQAVTNLQYIAKIHDYFSDEEYRRFSKRKVRKPSARKL